VDARTPAEEVDPSSATTRVEFGACLRAVRSAAGLSLRELASKTSKTGSLALSRSTMEDAELGRTLPKLDWLVVYLAACGVDEASQRAWKRARAALASLGLAKGELGRLPQVGTVDPRQLGVHPAITVAGPGERPGQGQRLPELPPYVPRDVDEELREGIVNLASHGGLIVLVGGSSTGKTRTAYEAICAELPDWRLLHPTDAAGLANAIAARRLPRSGVVVWLDDAQQYLTGPDRLTIGVVRALLNPDQPMVLVATMWPQWYERLTTPPPVDAALTAEDADDIDPHRHSRQILTTAARVIRLGSFNNPEYARAKTRAGEDPRLAAALQDSHYGVTEILAAAPQLVERFEYTANPYAKAIMTAAIDYRRLGHTVPLTGELLETAAVGYLTEQQVATASPHWFSTAIDHATGLLHGATSSLIPVPGTSMGTIIGYTVADYLLQYGQAARRDIPPPISIWEAGIGHITDLSIRLALAREAYRRKLYQHAELLARPAAETGIPIAMIVLARSFQGGGRVKEAEDWLRRAARTGNPNAMAALADWLERAGRAGEAEGWYRRAAELGNPDIVLILANWLRRAGRVEEAEEWYRRAAGTGHPHAMLVLGKRLSAAGQSEEAEEWYRRAAGTGDHDAMAVLAKWLERAGQSEEAEEWYRRAAGTGNLNGMVTLMHWLWRAGKAREAKEWYRRAVEAGNSSTKLFPQGSRRARRRRARQAAAETGDAEAMVAVAHSLGNAGRADEAERWYRRAAEAGHPHEMVLGKRLGAAGQSEEAEEWYRRAAEAGNPNGMVALADLLGRAGRAEEAERWYRRAAEAGHPHAMLVLGKRLGAAGQSEEAEEWYRRAAEAGNPNGMVALGNWLGRAGKAGEAEEWYRRAAGTGNPNGMVALADWLGRAGRAEEAERWYCRAAEAGNPNAMWALARWLEHAERIEEAEEWYRRAAETGNPKAIWALADWLGRAGRAEEAERWYLRAAETGNPNAMLALADWLGRAGKAQGAEEWSRRAAEAGNPNGMRAWTFS
jgi:hypothetical protein